MKPIIGITPNYSYREQVFSVHEDYIHAVTKAGGLPMVLFPDHPLPFLLDGLILTGGGDIDPLLFEEEPLRQSGEISPLRDRYELLVCKEAFQASLPLLGICRGMQIMNIAAGGGIYQDIAVQTNSTLKHNQEAPRAYGTHSISVTPDSLLAQLWKRERLTVNSVHHQAISTPAEGFLVAARSADGLAEAIAHQDPLTFAVGVQWHPEAMKTKEQQMIFEALIQAATAYHTKKGDQEAWI